MRTKGQNASTKTKKYNTKEAGGCRSSHAMTNEANHMEFSRVGEGPSD